MGRRALVADRRYATDAAPGNRYGPQRKGHLVAFLVATLRRLHFVGYTSSNSLVVNRWAFTDEASRLSVSDEVWGLRVATKGGDEG